MAAGLVLGERELSESEPRHEIPAFEQIAVTIDDRYSGGGLAYASGERLSEI